ncbi:ion transporter [Methanococcoides orientis]|uniref:potassium channel family protein n=1 Tax=Methanococcoides orientis TaxID=2822137 RepID=UPI001E4C1A5E|nr:potassium channel family protein [Methanococcoides orientis]UGV41148.1 ion transporter [Methanococcoides orientis]
MALKNDTLANKIESKLETPMIIIAIFVLPLVLIELEIVRTTPQIVLTAQLLDDAIWFIFLAEFVLLFSLHSMKVEYAKSNWFMLLLLILTPPIVVPEGFSSLRSLRSLRIFRALRSFRVIIAIKRGISPIYQIFQKNSMQYVTAYSLVLIVLSGTLFSRIENLKFSEGVWWSLTTVTTVGYGDLYPETLAGKFLAFFVMIVGIGFVSVLTANVAAYFVENDLENESNGMLMEKINELSDKIDELDRKISDK